MKFLSTSLIMVASLMERVLAQEKSMKFGGHEYDLYTDSKNYDDISGAIGRLQNACGSPAHLVTITSAEENEAVYAMLDGTGDDNAYIGLHDQVNEMQWQWVTDENYDYQNWYVGEPNDHGNGEDCVQIGFASGSNWNDISCSDIRYYIVEYDSDSDNCGASISGDPHVRTWGGEKYDFHGVCDLVMIQNPEFANNLGMDIHIRTKQTKSWSYVSSAVLRIGVHTLEVMGGKDSSKYWIDGVENSEMNNLSGYVVTHERITSKKQKFEVVLPRGSISIQTFKEMVRVDFHNVHEEEFGASLGLLGSYGNGEKIGRDKVTVIEDTNEFGQMWQVLQSEDMLFHNVEGPQGPEKCRIPEVSSIRRHLKESLITEEDARIACSRVNPSDFDLCVFDVMATNDLEVPGAY